MNTRPSSRASSSAGRPWPSVLLAFLAGVAVTIPLVLVLDGGDEAPTDTTAPAPSEVVAHATEEPGTFDVTDAVDVRTEPGMSAPSELSLGPDARGLLSTGRIAIAGETLWREISVRDGGTGWVPASALVETGPDQPTVDRGIPAEALATADAIAAAAEAGDLDQLAQLALAGQFTATFGGDVTTPAELVALWESIGRDEVIAAVLGLVDLPNWYETAAQTAAGETVAIFVSPRFMHEPSNAENRRVLEEALGVDYVERSIADGQYLGWRMGITADGDWRFFVAGD